MRPAILVTGARGNVGSEVLKALAAAAVPARAAERTSAPAGMRLGDMAEPVVFDFERPATFGPALDGIERVFLVRPPAISDVRRLIFPFIDAAQRAGVRQIVFLSLLGAQHNRFVPHYKIEQHIEAAGIPFTFLRASFFMQNFSTTHRAEIAERNEIAVPAGKGATSFVDARDVAAVAALALTGDGHANRAYDLTGGEALDYYQVAAQFSAVLGRQITYRNPSLLQFILRQRAQGLEWQFAMIMAAIYSTARLGLAGRIADDVPRLLGRPAITLQQFVADYRDCWAGAAAQQPVGAARRAT